MKKPTLQNLLRWAKEHSIYIEIYVDGSAECQWGESYDIRVDGGSLYQALTNARKEYTKCEA